MSDRTKAILVAVTFAALIAVECIRLGGPAVKSLGTPERDFSGGRAVTTLKKVIVDEPHPVGSAAHETVRERVVAQLTALGYDTGVERRFACSAYGVCANVANVIARQPGVQDVDGSTVILAAHYDSVAAGPGASDDGSGVAVLLEIARNIRGERFRNPVMFLIDDAEESGLLGAEAFLADEAHAKSVGILLNIEARGTRGPSLLFETSHGNRNLVAAFASTLPRPSTSSLFATIYDLLPNDTDLTVFKRAGKAGLNFAIVRGPTRYHTPLDDVRRVDAPTMQHRGDQLLAMTRTFANRDLHAAANGNAVWFDVLQWFVICWPASWTLAIVITALLATVAAIALQLRRGTMRGSDVALGALAFVAALVVTFFAATFLAWVTKIRFPAIWVAHPTWSIAAMWLTGIAVALASTLPLRRRATFDSLLTAHALMWNVLALAVAIGLPGASFLFVVPGLVLALGALLRALGPSRANSSDVVIAMLGTLAATIVFGRLALILYDGLGAMALPLLALFLALITTTASPLLLRFAPQIALAALVGAIGCTLYALTLPVISRDSPRPLNVAHYTDADSGSTLWLADTMSPPLRNAAQFEPQRRNLFQWYRGGSAFYVAPAPPTGAPAVEARLVSDVAAPQRVVTIDVTSPRHAQRVALVWRSTAAVTSIRVNGTTLPPRPPHFVQQMAQGWYRASVRADSMRVELTLRGEGRVEAIATDASFGVPPSGAALLTARTASAAVPFGEGDATFTQRRLRW